LTAVAEHDHNLLEALYEMQQIGFRIDEGERAKYEAETAVILTAKDAECALIAEPVIKSRLASFHKPHLFYVEKQCECCNGGKLSRAHCWRCGGLPKKPEKKADYIITGVNDLVVYTSEDFASTVAVIEANPKPGKPSTVAQLRELLPPCSVCQATGKIGHWLPFSSGSSDAVSDVLYRGLRIPPRKYKGKETIAAAQLEPIQGRHPLVRAIVSASKVRADLSTVKRLRPGADGKLHCVFDPWGTESGRVASREGLLQPGTNAMNIPKPARRFVVPDDGYVFLYPDMAQIEARAVAVLSGDKGLLRAFTEPVNWPGHPKHGVIDSHTIVQQMVSKWVEITRDQAKRTTYAVIYGGTGEQLAIELSKEAMQKGSGALVTAQQGCAIVEAFFMAFPGVRRYHQAIEQELIQTRTLRSLTGRERHWPGRIMDDGNRVLNEVIKQAWSYKPQEMGAHILGLGMLELREKQRHLATPLIHVHDALLMQCKIAQLEEAKAVAKAALSRELFGMWFPADMKAGANWYEAS
jgi:DNA polymerase I-like protein with 3'-5' exonuclease and polymerase domains